VQPFDPEPFHEGRAADVGKVFGIQTVLMDERNQRRINPELAVGKILVASPLFSQRLVTGDPKEKARYPIWKIDSENEQMAPFEFRK
jgi:hypothetical protein